ncbi:phosphate-starvation-inducible PsiE family protein [Roseofilum sp. BLCC_M154]|uniref:Phosphate-starvation-inducible PsiE family protein n=2 Tax=Roseofilum TaxID=1233426 RepID=A0ABT7AP74_9CYAN|nr:phosphate-starvation-inducible PsiE family protein [Roseofilum acuticapitatum]MDJ1167888.1 phosphate-starvation-inducible PsiE family protein [Roseofilum acuticapitatum BLCC-M154]
MNMEPLSSNPSPRSFSWFNGDHIVRVLELVQDLIVISLCIGLFSFMVMQLREMFLSLLPPLNFPRVTSDILFLLILVELFRLLIIYLKEHRVSIGVAVEVSIVSVLREIIVRGILETPWVQVMAACSFLIVLGSLLVIRAWIPPTFDGIDPEQQVSQRHRIRFGQALSERDRQLEAQPVSTLK